MLHIPAIKVSGLTADSAALGTCWNIGGENSNRYEIVVKMVSQQKRPEMNTSGEMCKSPETDKGTECMSCIWCYLIKEGVKKAYSGIRRLRAAGAR